VAIVDKRLRDLDFDALVQDIRRLDPNFGFLEITGNAKAPEVCGWAGEGMARVRRDGPPSPTPAVRSGTTKWGCLAQTRRLWHGLQVFASLAILPFLSSREPVERCRATSSSTF